MKETVSDDRSRSSVGNLFHRQGAAYRKERLVIAAGVWQAPTKAFPAELGTPRYFIIDVKTVLTFIFIFTMFFINKNVT